jgi:hypothetical protein
MEITYDSGDFLVRLSADQMLSLRYALGVGVERLGSDARFFAHPPKGLEVPEGHARTAQGTYERAKAVSDGIEALVRGW